MGGPAMLAGLGWGGGVMGGPAMLAGLGWGAALAAVLVALWLRAVLARRAALVAEAAHELRAPLCAAGLALHGAARDPRRVAAAERELVRAGLALEDLSCAPRGRRAPDVREAVDVRAVVAEVVAARQDEALGFGAGLYLDAGSVPALVLCGRLRLAQAVGNLVANAAEHGWGDIDVRVRTHGDRRDDRGRRPGLRPGSRARGGRGPGRETVPRAPRPRPPDRRRRCRPPRRHAPHRGPGGRPRSPAGRSAGDADAPAAVEAPPHPPARPAGGHGRRPASARSGQVPARPPVEPRAPAGPPRWPGAGRASRSNSALPMRVGDTRHRAAAPPAAPNAGAPKRVGDARHLAAPPPVAPVAGAPERVGDTRNLAVPPPAAPVAGAPELGEAGPGAAAESGDGVPAVSAPPDLDAAADDGARRAVGRGPGRR